MSGYEIGFWVLAVLCIYLVFEVNHQHKKRIKAELKLSLTEWVLQKMNPRLSDKELHNIEHDCEED